jgi:hypothetical protein
MSESMAADHLQLFGEVVELVDHAGKQQAKIQLRRCYIVINTEQLDDVHLGDSVVIDADTITVEPAPDLGPEESGPRRGWRISSE